jgi:hypothetical protein
MEPRVELLDSAVPRLHHACGCPAARPCVCRNYIEGASAML